MSYILVDLEDDLKQIRDNLITQLKTTDSVIAVHEKWIHAITKQISTLYKAQEKIKGGFPKEFNYKFPIQHGQCSPSVRSLYLDTHLKLREAELAHIDQLGVELKAAYAQWLTSLVAIKQQVENADLIVTVAEPS